MSSKNKKNLSKIIYIFIILGILITLAGCNWFDLGLLNIIDPQAQIRIDFNPLDSGDPEEGCFNLGVSTINEVEFFVTGFEYDYHGEDFIAGTVDITELSRQLDASFYVRPSTSPGTQGEVTSIENIPLYVQDVVDYVSMDPLIIEVNCDINLLGEDGSGHKQVISVVTALPVIQPGVDLTPPVASIETTPDTPSGDPPLLVVFDASGSTDDRGIATINWNFGDGTSSSDVVVSHTYNEAGKYIVILTVTDFFGNSDIATKEITVGIGEVGAKIETTPSPANGFVPFTVGFDASGSTVETSPVVSYEWDFDGDGVTDDTGVTTVNTFNTSGTYLVQLTVTDSDSNEYIAFVTVTANDKP